MLHVWLIPAAMILVAALSLFYLLIRFKGGTGVRTEGRTVLDQPQDEENLPPK